MKIRVTFYAVCRDLAGTDTTEIILPVNATGQQLWKELIDRYPLLNGIAPQVALAVNNRYVKPDAVLQDNDDVSLIPPVSGG